MLDVILLRLYIAQALDLQFKARNSHASLVRIWENMVSWYWYPLLRVHLDPFISL